MAAPRPILGDVVLRAVPSLTVSRDAIDKRKHYTRAVSMLLVLLGAWRIAITYSSTPQTFDEPCHVAAALEFLDRGTYELDPIHPPLARIAIGTPLYLAGERYPTSGRAATSSNYNDVGNSILYDSGQYARNLRLARYGVLPFFLFAAAVVFVWARRLFGDLAALLATALFTTIPIVLAFSATAYTDIVAAATQSASFFAFQLWLEKRSLRKCILLGLAAGLALLAKATTLLYLPAAGLAMWGTRLLLERREKMPARGPIARILMRDLAISLVIAAVVLWGGYRFSIGHLSDAMHLSPAAMPSFQHFPAPLRSAVRRLALANPVVPAPAFLRGTAEAWVLNKSAPESYLLGQRKAGGFWNFFLVGVAVKTPIPVLILGTIGFLAVLRRGRRWATLAPPVCALAILLVTMPVTYNAGVRHVLVVFPLLAIVAGYAGSLLWKWDGKQRLRMRLAVVLLLAWQIVSTVSAQHDYIAYFNEFAAADPGRVLVAGCDLDCGQDVFRLAADLRARHVAHVSLALWSSADMGRMGLPSFDVLQPGQPATGWVAISERALRFGDVFHSQYPPGAFDWLAKYQPAGHVGKTILLYNIPPPP